MDDEMKRRFADTFYSIRKEFEQVFKALFGGGRAELKLTNPDDLLNTGGGYHCTASRKKNCKI
ncbi:hypothetical protein RCO48_10910 [Peribacillus frigoritolerans]|nr:hypothetical protein [Peribacillus frigoritolerans]